MSELASSPVCAAECVCVRGASVYNIDARFSNAFDGSDRFLSFSRLVVCLTDAACIRRSFFLPVLLTARAMQLLFGVALTARAATKATQ